MSSVKTLLLKGTYDFFDSKKAHQKTKISVGFVSMCLWALTAIIAVSSPELSGNVTGVSVTFNLQDVLIMLFSTFLMTRGLANTCHYLIYPWICLSGWNIFHCQYPNIMKMLYTINHAKTVTRLAYAAVGLHVTALVIKILLIMRLFQLAIILWYQDQLQKEVL